MFIFHRTDQQFLFASLIELSTNHDWASSQQQTVMKQPKADMAKAAS